MNTVIDQLISLAQVFGLLALTLVVLTLFAGLWERPRGLRHRINRPANQETSDD